MKTILLLIASLALTACDSNEDTSKKPSPNAAQPVAKQTNQVSSTPDLTASPAAPATKAKTAKVARQYTAAQVTQGEAVFNKNCQSCHSKDGVGETREWQTPFADGTFPAPPLNGTAHTWHHNKKVLLGTIDRGGIPLGGRMPAFKNVLTKDEKNAVLAYIQNLWSDEIYAIWIKNNT